MKKADGTEPLCETSEPCRPLIAGGELERIRSGTGRRVAEAFDYRSCREIACMLRISCCTIDSIIAGRELPSTEMLLSINCITGVSIH